MTLPKLVQTVIDVLRSLGGSLLGVDLSYHPRRATSGEKIDSKEMLEAIRKSLDGFAFDSGELAKADPKLLLDRAKDSLEESKKQTEYQDAKAGRLLTIVAFLTAAVGTVFGKFIDLYPLHNGSAPISETSPWIVVTYLLFGIYLLLVAAGALVTFHAMSTRFVWPGGSNLADKTDAESLLFWQQIVRTMPESWGNAFAGDKGKLLRTYYTNYVAEAYLIATKVADKLRYLDPGQRLLIAGIRVLLGLFLLIILTFWQVAPPPKVVASTTAATSGTAAAVASPSVAASPATASTPGKGTPSASGQPEATAVSNAVATAAPQGVPISGRPASGGK